VAAIEAEYEDGILRLSKPLHLRHGERVEVIVKRRPDPSRWDLERLARTSSGEDEELSRAGLDRWGDVLKDEDEH
jgi:predicted DNA-binding antitoxin AbrB/MazE fold protein